MMTWDPDSGMLAAGGCCDAAGFDMAGGPHFINCIVVLDRLGARNVG